MSIQRFELRADIEARALSLEAIDESFDKLRQKSGHVHKDGRKIKTLSILSTVVVFFIGVFSYIVYSHIMDLRENARIADLARDVAARPPAVAQAGDDSARPASGQGSDPAEPDEEMYPLNLEPRPIMPLILSLREEFGNDDIVGYISIEGTDIDYMVMQSNDNEYYLDRNVFGQETAAGSVFMDYATSAAVLGRNTILYAHNMRDGSMFHNLRFYQSKQFFDSNRYIRLTTLHDETIWEAFAFYATHIDFNYIQVYFPDDNNFLSLVDKMVERSIHETDVHIGADDLILTLSTCEGGADKDIRYVLNARLTGRVGAEEIDHVVV